MHLILENNIAGCQESQPAVSTLPCAGVRNDNIHHLQLAVSRPKVSC